MINDAIDVGYRHIDTASYYHNEKAIGHAVNEYIRAGKVRREDIFITSKLLSDDWNRKSFVGFTDHSARQQAMDKVKLSLERLNLTYIDLMLIHEPSYNLQTNSEIWSGLEDALHQGLVKSIGVSNFNIEQLTDLLKTATVIPAMNQVECHPQKNQRELIGYCAKYNIQITAYSPLGSETLINDPTIIRIGKNHNKSSAQVMIRWQIQRRVVVIPKSTIKGRMRENIDVFDFSLNDDEIQILERLRLPDFQELKSVQNKQRGDQGIIFHKTCKIV